MAAPVITGTDERAVPEHRRTRSWNVFLASGTGCADGWMPDARPSVSCLLVRRDAARLAIVVVANTVTITDSDSHSGICGTFGKLSCAAWAMSLMPMKARMSASPWER
jgi:hypothetical protein